MILARTDARSAPPARSGLRIPGTAEALALLELGLWSVFVFLAAGAAAEVYGGSERLAWLTADAFALYAIATRPKLYAGLALRTAPMLSWGVVAGLSAFWSLSPDVSIYHGVQLLLTLLVGGVAAARLGLAGLMRAVFLGFGAATVLSVAAVAAGAMDPLYRGGAWQGLFDHKNVLGAVATAWLAAALALCVDRLRVVAVAAALIALAVVLQTRSGTSIVATAGVLGTYFAYVAMRGGARGVALAIAGAAVAASVAGLVIVLARFDPLRAVLDTSGKDLTLTGRTVLWRFGVEAFGDKPLVGHGFKGYWETAATTRDYLRHFVGQNLWHFHNTAVEVAVGFGLLGLVLLAWGLVSAGASIVRVAVVRAGAAGFWALALLVHVLTLTLTENPLLDNHSIWQALLFAAYAAAALALSARSAAHLRAAPETAAGRPR